MELRRDDLVRAAGDEAGQRAGRLERVEREIRQAQAEALGRTGERLADLLARLAAADRHLDTLLQWAAATPGGEAVALRVRAETDARNRLRDEAARVQQNLVIQREALGLARHAAVLQCYPVPGRRRAPGPPIDRGRTP